MIKACLFDYDGVMTLGAGDRMPAQKLSANLGVSYDEAQKWIDEIWDGISTGKLDDEAAWHIIEKHYGQPIAKEKRDIWYTWGELTPLPKMIDLIGQLKARGLPVGVVSNVMPALAQIIRENGGYDEFDFCVLSYQAGVRKPAPKIYQDALAKLDGIAPEDVLFLDDREKCTTGAAQLGMQTILVTNHDEAIREVLRLVGSANH